MENKSIYEPIQLIGLLLFVFSIVNFFAEWFTAYTGWIMGISCVLCFVGFLWQHYETYKKAKSL